MTAETHLFTLDGKTARLQTMANKLSAPEVISQSLYTFGSQDRMNSTCHEDSNPINGSTSTRLRHVEILLRDYVELKKILE